jgi:hypothetical protein
VYGGLITTDILHIVQRVRFLINNPRGLIDQGQGKPKLRVAVLGCLIVSYRWLLYVGAAVIFTAFGWRRSYWYCPKGNVRARRRLNGRFQMPPSSDRLIEHLAARRIAV